MEWRLIPAGYAKLTLAQGAMNNSWKTDLQLESTGLVGKLYKVADTYRTSYQDSFCAVESFLEAKEGKRHRETTIRFDTASKKAIYLEKDLNKNSIVRSSDVPIPACVQDIVGGLFRLRTMTLEPGQTTQIPMTDGKKSSQIQVAAQNWEEIKTKAGTFKTLKYEVFAFNGALYDRNARLYVWLTNDARRLPVQIQVRMSFTVGTITLQLEREEKT